MRNIKLLRGLVAILLATVVVLGVLLIKSGSSPPAEGDPKPVVEADDRVVARIGEREFRLSLLQNNLLERYGRELLSQLLDREALRLEAERLELKLTREEVDQELVRMQQGYDSEEQFYDSMYSQLGLTKEDIREDVYYKLLSERIATRAVRVTDSEVDAYMREHPEEFQLVSSLRIQIIINETLQQSSRTLELYRNGADFGRLARERSIDTITAEDSGDLGWVEDSDPFVPQEILLAARGLQVGEVAGPIETAEGYALVRLQDKKELHKGTLNENREAVRKMLSLQKAPPIKDVLESLRAKYESVILDPSLR